MSKRKKTPAKECYVAWCSTCGEFLYADATKAGIETLYESGHCVIEPNDVLALKAVVLRPPVTPTGDKRGAPHE